MKAGYLAIEALPQGEHQTDLIKLLSWDELPHSEGDNADKTANINNRKYPENVHYIARFNDILAATMHFHNGLRRKLEDLNEHTYRAELTHAIAVIEAENDLRHERIWIDPAISLEELEVIKKDADRIRSKKEKIDKAIQMVGYFAVALLILFAVASII